MEFCVFISCEMCFLAEILRCAWSHCLVDVDENALTFSHSEREIFDRNERSLALNRQTHRVKHGNIFQILQNQIYRFNLCPDN